MKYGTGSRISFKTIMTSMLIIMMITLTACSTGPKQPTEDVLGTLADQDFGQSIYQDEIDNWVLKYPMTTNIPALNEMTMSQRSGFDKSAIFLEEKPYSREKLIDQLMLEAINENDSIIAVDSLNQDWNEQALLEAARFLDGMPQSALSLTSRLVDFGYTPEEAAYATQNSGADWKDQAEESAKMYKNIGSFTKKTMIDQLRYEGFTDEEALHGTSKVGL